LIVQQPPQAALTEILHVFTFQPHGIGIAHHPRPHSLKVGCRQPQQTCRPEQSAHFCQRQPRLRDVSSSPKFWRESSTK
jgi:hypothetical protein